MKPGIPILALLLLFIALTAACGAPSAAPTPRPAPTETLAPTPSPEFEAVPVSTENPEPTPTEVIEVTMDNSAFEINQKLGRGVNLGNALEAPNEGEWGVTLQEEYFQLIADQGFDSVRIPIRWSTHAAAEAPYTIDPAFFARIDWAVDNALSRGLAVVINFHHYEEIFRDPAGHEARFLALWAQVAEHYQDAPPELVFEILNEPHDALTSELWNELLVKALAVIRATNPSRAVMLGPGEWNNLYALAGLQLPEADRNLIVTFHYYLPFEFTHQGAEWAPGSEAWLGTTWEGAPDQQGAIQSEFGLVADWAAQHNRPIYLGEFGAYNKAKMDSRARWTAFVARTAEEYGFSWGYWEFCAGFGIYEPGLKIWMNPLLEALLPQE
jgi:endoglucanase